MKRNRMWLAVATLCIAALANAARAGRLEPVPLWPGDPPLKAGEGSGHEPKLHPFLPDSPSSAAAAVIVCPGGAYGFLSMDHEGFEVARLLNAFGVAAFVLEYRLGSAGYRYPAPMLDAQRAVRLVRARAEEWKIDPERVGMIGFSAGGHLTAATATLPPLTDGLEPDAIDSGDPRPDFVMLIYPVISMAEGVTHAGSRQNLLGPDPDEELVRLLSAHEQVTRETPPAFLIHGGMDGAVIPSNSELFYQAMRRARVPVELHVFQTGGHGFGLARGVHEPHGIWPELMIRWLDGMGMLGDGVKPPTIGPGPRD